MNGRSEYLTEDMYEDMLAGLGVIHSIMGEEFVIAYAQQAGDKPVQQDFVSARVARMK